MARAPHADTVQPTLQDVARATEALRLALPPQLDAAEADLVELGVAEALTNAVRHGQARTVRLELSLPAGNVRVDIWDDGKPIPAEVLAAAGPRAFCFDPHDLVNLPESGLGLAIVKAAFDELDYASSGGTNHLALVRHPRS